MNRSKREPEVDGRRRDDAGFALAGVLLILVVMTTLSVAAWASTRSESAAGEALRASAKAFFAAEAGLSQVRAEWSASTTEGLEDPGNSRVTHDWAEISENGCEYRTVVRRLNGFNLTTKLFSVTSTGRTRGARGARRTLYNLVKMESELPKSAISSAGDFRIDGSPHFKGECADLHANGTMDITGADVRMPEGSMVTSATDVPNNTATEYDDTGADPIPDEFPVPEQEVEELTPWDLCSDEADYWLRRDPDTGNHSWVPVANPADSVIFETATTSEKEAIGWDWTNDEDGFGGTTTDNEYTTIEKDIAQGVYCADDDIVIGQDHGKLADNTQEDPLPQYTFLVQGGSIQMAGNPAFRPADSNGEVLWIVDGDMHISGNHEVGEPNTFEGVMYSGAQCRITGNPFIAGFLVCKDESNPAVAQEWVTENRIDGNPELIFNCAGFMQQNEVEPVGARAWVQQFN